MAVNAWMFPPVFGYNTEVSQGASKTLSAFNFANLTAKPSYLSQTPHLSTIQSVHFKKQRERERESRSRCEDGSKPSKLTGSTKSYDLMCIVPKRSLLKTVISGWLWRGITPVAGIKNMHNCTSEKYINNLTIHSEDWKQLQELPHIVTCFTPEFD